MNAPLNQKEFESAFMHQDSMYKLVNDTVILGAVKPAHYPLVYDKVTLAVNPTVNGDYMLTFYKEVFRSIKTFKTVVYQWMCTS